MDNFLNQDRPNRLDTKLSFSDQVPRINDTFAAIWRKFDDAKKLINNLSSANTSIANQFTTIIGAPPGPHNLMSATHTDTIPAGVANGDMIVGNAGFQWQNLAIAIPAANVRNVLGVDSTDLAPAWKTSLDAVNPVAITIGAVGAPGTSLIFSHRDHTHASPATWTATAHNLLSAIHGDTTTHAAAVGGLITGQAGPVWAYLGPNATANNMFLRSVSSGAASWEQVLSSDVIIPNGIGTPSFDDVQDFLQETRSSGRITGGTVSIHAPPNGTVDVSLHEGMIFTANALGSPYIFFKQAAASGIALTDLSVNWVYYDWNGGVPQYVSTVDRSLIHDYDQFTVGRAWRSGNTVEVQATGHNIYNKDRRAHNRLILKYGNMDRYAGATLTAHATPLRIQTDAGSWFVANTPFTTPAMNTYYVWYRSGGAWTKSGPFTLFSDVFDGGVNKLYETYQNGINLATLGAAKYYTHWVYCCPDGNLYVVLGAAEYNNVGAAQAATVPASLPPYCVNWARLIGRVIGQKTGAAFFEVDSVWAMAFTLSSATDHASLANLLWHDAGHNSTIFNVNQNSDSRIGIGISTPASLVEIYNSAASPVLTITGAHATDYDPQIHFRTDAIPTVKWSMGVDATDDSFFLNYGMGFGTLINWTTAGVMSITTDGEKINLYENDVAIANGYIKFTNNTLVATVYTPAFKFKGNAVGANVGSQLVADCTSDLVTDTGTIYALSARQNNAAVTNRPLFVFQNFTTDILKIWPDGDVNNLLKDFAVENDTYGLILGAGTDARIFFDGTYLNFRTLVAGTPNYKFDCSTSVSATCNVLFSGGTSNDSLIEIRNNTGASAGNRYRIRSVYNVVPANCTLKFQNDTIVAGTFIDRLILNTDGTLRTPLDSVYHKFGAGDDIGIMFNGSHMALDYGLVCAATPQNFYILTTNGGATSYVGIGYAVGNPLAAMLDLQGTFKCYESVNTTTPQALIQQANNTGDCALEFYNSGFNYPYTIGIDASDSFFKINFGATVGAATHFVLDDAGKIGMGRNPTRPLDLYVSNANTTPTMIIENAGAGDVFTNYYLSGGGATTGACLGIKNKDTDYFVLNYGTALSDVTGGTTSEVLGLIMDSSSQICVGGRFPASIFEIYRETAHPILTITGRHATDYDPQIQFRTDSPATVKWSLGVDATADTLFINYGTGAGTTGIVMTTAGHVGILRPPTSVLDVVGEARFVTPDTTDASTINCVNPVSVTGTTIIFSISTSCIAVIYGSDGAGNTFCDFVSFTYAATPTVLVSATRTGAPAARTYSQVNGDSKLAMASGTYIIHSTIYGDHN